MLFKPFSLELEKWPDHEQSASEQSHSSSCIDDEVLKSENSNINSTCITITPSHMTEAQVSKIIIDRGLKEEITIM